MPERSYTPLAGGFVRGVCNTPHITTAKEVTIADYTLCTGDLLLVTFTNGNATGAPTLNINGVGAAAIKLGNYMPTATATTVAAGGTLLLFYDGTYYQMMGSQRTTDSDADTYDRMLWNEFVTAGETIGAYKLLMFGADGKAYALTGNVSADAYTKPVQTVELQLNSPILYYEWYADVTPEDYGVNNLYDNFLMYNMLAYTANTDFQTGREFIYLKGTITASGNFKLDNTTYTSFLTQALPIVDDGFVYVLLGYMHDTTTMRLFSYHPIYEFKDGKLRQYVPAHTHSGYEAPLRFTATDVLTSAWVADTTYATYGFRAAITLTGALTTMIPDVVFSPVDSDTGNFCSVADSYAGGVYIYAKAVPAATITIPHIKLEVV